MITTFFKAKTTRGSAKTALGKRDGEAAAAPETVVVMLAGEGDAASEPVVAPTKGAPSAPCAGLSGSLNVFMCHRAQAPSAPRLPRPFPLQMTMRPPCPAPLPVCAPVPRSALAVLLFV